MTTAYLRKLMGDGSLPSYIGGRPMVYLTQRGPLCAECATHRLNDTQDLYDVRDIPDMLACHEEGAPIYCDECGDAIFSYYGNPEEGE